MTSLPTPPTDFPYWKKQNKALFSDLEWNIPEQDYGNVTVIGGNLHSFSGTIKISEYLSGAFPLNSVSTLLPDALESKLPKMENLRFAPSTPSGSFAEFPDFATDGVLIYGELSKNSTTGQVLSEVLVRAESSFSDHKLGRAALSVSQKELSPAVITRDSIDLLADHPPATLPENLTIIASFVQLQKLFRALYFPKVLLLTMPLPQAVEALHKFTLSYPCTILTLHSDTILTAKAGKVISTPLEKTTFTPLSLWQGTLAANALALQLYNPSHPLEALNAAIFH